MRVLDLALDSYPQIVPVVVSGYGGVTEAVAAMKRGAHDFLIKPFELPQLSKVLKTGLDRQQHRQENAEIRAQLADRFHFDGIIGHFHVQTNKSDPGPALQWDRLLQESRALVTPVGTR